MVLKRADLSNKCDDRRLAVVTSQSTNLSVCILNSLNFPRHEFVSPEKKDKAWISKFTIEIFGISKMQLLRLSLNS